MGFIKSIRLDGLLSFAPGTPAIELKPLNVLIGPNGSGKSNLIEAIGLLSALPTGFASAIRQGGGIGEWLWKGTPSANCAELETVISGTNRTRGLTHSMRFVQSGPRAEIVEERLSLFGLTDEAESKVIPVYTNHSGTTPTAVSRSSGEQPGPLQVEFKGLSAFESVLSQRRDPERFPEMHFIGAAFEGIQSFREWAFGTLSAVRDPQPTDLPVDYLLPDASNLALLLNQIENSNALVSFNESLRIFLPRFERFSTRIMGGTAQFFLHERGLSSPIPSTRLSDGTLRFLALLALLRSPTPSLMLCLEEPELGLHPDALSLMAELLVDASQRSQLVVTTHSDALVSALTDHAESVMVCENRGGTQIERLDPEKLKYWLDRYRLGEVWRIGELGGNP